MGLISFIMGFEDIYLWKDPLVSGPVFGVILITLISTCYYSTVSVVAYSGLFILGTMVGLKLYVYVMNNLLKKNVEDPIQKYSSVDTSISQDKVNSVASCMGDKLNTAVTEIRRLVLVENMLDSVKFGLSLWFLTYIGNWFNAMTLVILAWVALFTVPKVYLNNKAAIDPILEKVKVQLDELQSKVGGFMPKKAAEAKKEE
ncbi:reticulon-1-A-like isoform X3 [Tigriopus californicus]|uniref:reticulon-1-A-like isoform X3 n=1 Tax=Tigriopus californicus TaxID=6832 RepID=UPI0027DA2FF8|nr:reticulon-1-A-like isoform X3 [Tigriopus californicus]